MKLLIDIGNTRAKIRVVEEGKTLFDSATDRFDAADAVALTERYPIEGAILSSVRERDEALCEALRSRVGRFKQLCGTMPLPIRIDCPTPELIGADRIAVAVGALALFPNRNALVVDFGTAITIDRVDEEGNFRPGNISLGASSRLGALHSLTALLPKVKLSEASDAIEGDSTATEMANGVAWGIAFEIEGYIARFAEKYVDPITIFTGGDAFFFEKRINNTIFAKSDLAFVGLERILDYDEE